LCIEKQPYIEKAKTIKAMRPRVKFALSVHISNDTVKKIMHGINKPFIYSSTPKKHNALITGKKLFAKMLRNENSKLFFVLVY